MQTHKHSICSFEKPGLALPTTLSSTPANFGRQQPPSVVTQPGSAPNQKQRVFTGTITKISDTFGLVDEDVFFQTRYGQLIEFQYTYCY